MEESKAAAFYEEQRASGAGAAKFKHGLGFTNRYIMIWENRMPKKPLANMLLWKSVGVL